MPQVTIHRRDTGAQLDAAGSETAGVWVTYSTAQVPPRQVFIVGAAVTDAQVADAIRKDLAAAQAQRPAIMDI